MAALRSGEYRQGRGLLCALHKEGASYCCLGVACEFYRQENPGFYTEDSAARGRRTYGLNRNVVVLPSEVVDWLGLSNSLGAHAGNDLVAANDSRRLTLAQIADLIEAEPEGLFKKESTETSKPEQVLAARAQVGAEGNDVA